MTDIEKLEFKNWTIIKMITYTVGIISVCLTVGYESGQIRSWANTTDNRLNKVEQWQSKADEEKHQKIMSKINSMSVAKNP